MFYSPGLTIPADEPDALATQKLVRDLCNALLPVGTIIMWGGVVASIPAGWALCNGLTVNGVVTPNLQDRFVMSSGPTFDPGEFGGNTTFNYAGSVSGHVLTYNQMPYHTHSISDPTHTHTANQGAHDHSYTRYAGLATVGAGAGSAAGIWQNTTTVNTGTDDPAITVSGAYTGIAVVHAGANWAHDHNFGISAPWSQFYPAFYAVCYIMRVAAF